MTTGAPSAAGIPAAGATYSLTRGFPQRPATSGWKFSIAFLAAFRAQVR